MTSRRKQPANPPGAEQTVQASVVLGRLVAGSTRVTPIVDFEGNSSGPLPARTAIALDLPTVERAVATRQKALLVFENGDPNLPILTGLIQPDQPPSPLEALLAAPRSSASTEPEAKQARIEARLDGERVVLEGKQEVVLKCGDASITLRRDGKVIVRGAYVETHSRGLNRIKGAAVKIN